MYTLPQNLGMKEARWELQYVYITKTEAQRDYVIRPSGARAGIQSRTVCKFCAIC